MFRVESMGEDAVPFPTLAVAMQLHPSHPESYIATSAEGVKLAEAFPVRGPGTMLRWQLTSAGIDVADAAGWTIGQPEFSASEYETVLRIALAEDLEQAS